MTRLSLILSLAVFAPALAPAAAFAQAQTGTGDGPGTTVTAPNTSVVGRTMPPGRGAGSATADERRERTPQQMQDDKISQGICIGCGPK